jgi:scytalone dehydratase
MAPSLKSHVESSSFVSAKQPNLDISLQGSFIQVILVDMQLTHSTLDYLELSKVVFDWADSYDSKVRSFIAQLNAHIALTTT